MALIAATSAEGGLVCFIYRVHGSQIDQLEITISTHSFEEYLHRPKISTKLCQNLGHKTKPAHIFRHISGPSEHFSKPISLLIHK